MRLVRRSRHEQARLFITIDGPTFGVSPLFRYEKPGFGSWHVDDVARLVGTEIDAIDHVRQLPDEAYSHPATLSAIAIPLQMDRQGSRELHLP